MKLSGSVFKNRLFGKQLLLFAKNYSLKSAAIVCPHQVTDDRSSRLILDSEPQSLNRIKSYEEIPGPKPLPLLGNSWRFFPIIGEYSISEIAKISFQLHQDFGEICKVTNVLGREDMVFVFNADEIEKCYRSQDPIPYRPSMPTLIKYKSEIRENFFGDVGGLISVHGEPWRKFRSRVQNPCLQMKTLRQYVSPLEGVTNEFIERLLTLQNDDQELPNDFENEIHKWSLESICLILLDTRLGSLTGNLEKDSESQKFIDAVKFVLRTGAFLELKAVLWRYFPTPLWKKYVRTMDYFRDTCMKHVINANNRLKAGQPGALDGEPSLLERVLMSEKDEKLATVMALDLLLVGIDTVSIATCSILYQLATRPVEQQKVFEELKRNIPDPDVPLTMTLLDKNQYTKAFIKEVLRQYSTIIGNGRTLQEDTVICGYKIPKGKQIIFPNLVVGNMEKYVTNASEFKPERWIKSPDNHERMHPFASLPFGYGARMCVGRRFADLEILVLLVKLLRKYKLEHNHEPLKYEVVGGAYTPKGNLNFKMTPRDD
jgi:cytochrome P450